MAEPAAPMSDLTPPEETVARARAIARDLGARLFISPSDLALYDELEEFLSGDGAVVRTALASLEGLTPAQLRRRLAEIGTPVPTPAAASAERAKQRGPGNAEEEYVSPWPVPETELGADGAEPKPAVEYDADDDSWLADWDRDALLDGAEQ